MFILSSSLFGKIATGSIASCVVASGGVVGYIYKDKIFGTSKYDFTYVAVRKNSTISASSDVGALTTTVGNKTTKNYQCKLTIGDKDHFDKNCTVIKWNQEVAKKPTSTNLFDEQIKETSVFNNQSTAILKISKKLYSLIDTSGKSQDISIVKKDDATKVFGGFNRLFEVDKNFTDPLTDVESSFFLMRITDASGSATLVDNSQNSFKCKVATEEPIDCKIHKAGTTNDTNNFNAQVNVALGTFASSDKAVGKYVVVEFTSTTKTVEQLKNKAVDIHVVTNANDTLTTANKLLTATVDQILFNNAALSTPSVYPLSPRYVRYVVKKATTSSFDNIDTNTKNFKCQFTDSATPNANINEDHSCLIEVFPTLSGTPKIHSYSSIYKPASTWAGVSSGTISQDHFVLTVDANKLFNLRPDWTTPATVVAVKATNTADANKSASFELLHEITENRATGVTNLALVKYKSTETDASWTLGSGKCGFEKTDSTGFSCSFYKTTLTNNEIENASLESSVETWSANPTQNTYYTLKLDANKNIADFDGKSILYHTATDNKKYVFDIVALMGGDVASGKTLFFTEANKRA